MHLMKICVPRQLQSWTKSHIRSNLFELVCRGSPVTVQCSREVSSNDAVNSLPSQARVVICGGGVIGSSIAYHLAERGWKDIVLLEQGKLTCGTTWHAAGLVGRLKSSSVETNIVKYSAALYKKLEDEGYPTGWKECGSLTVARTKDRMLSYRKAIAKAKVMDIEIHELSPNEVSEKSSLVRTDDIVGGMWIPGDAATSAPDVAIAMATAAKDKGAKIIEGCAVEKVLTKNNNISGVETNLGTIQCEYFVNCAGQWARSLGKKSNPRVRVPLHSTEHYYLVTKPFGVDRMTPVIRDHDGYTYFREWSGGIMAGGFEPVAKPVFHNGIPDKFEFGQLPEDWDHFQVLLEQILHRIPSIQTAEIRQLFNGPESFTPDCKYILGEAPEINNYFVAAGMTSIGIASAGGVGRHMAEWIIDGSPSVDLWSVDIRRFVDLHNNKKYLRDRVRETLGASFYRIPNLPFYDFKTARNVRVTPVFPRTQAAGAVFQEVVGFERALYFPRFHTHWITDDPDQDAISHINPPGTFGKPAYFDIVRSEYWACREGVCLIDMSSFTKLELKSAGREVVDFLQYVCSNDIDKPVGSVIHTGMQNTQGGYENDVSLLRTHENSYFLICSTSQQTRSQHWLRKHLPADGSVQIGDVTSMYTAINVIGPKAEELLSNLTDTNMSKQDFSSMNCKIISVGHASGIRAMRLTHSGEDGWILYIPSEYALHVYDTLMAAGKDYGIRNAGYFALRCLRIEKFFAYWGQELSPYTTPLECSREFRVRLDKPDFIGKAALEQQHKDGITKKLVQFLVEGHNLDNDPWPFQGEPIYRNGHYCGTVTSSGYGYTLEKLICLGFVHSYNQETKKEELITNDFIMRDAKFEIDIAGKRYPLKANIYPPTLPAATTGNVYVPRTSSRMK
ncbi:unnamed protein product [Owenia fusiformis]|uniref:Pyruvate dehydrogenase phosphatase regulatory subunit, mitochondrial n=1 Tax=Owenia fusiformis TaxID=6347 RepID=A0A8S4NIN1_OWEFU|nr:unnamed protein product [Owenia fusiformis]